MSALVVTRWGARHQGRLLPCAVGRGGIGLKRGEGDGITPQGTMRLRRWLYRPDRLGGLNAATIGPRDIWSDDPRDPHYNSQKKLGVGPEFGPEFSHERLRRTDPLYDLVGVLDYNLEAPVAGAGSAIFLHVWRKPRHPTEGCIAFELRDLLWLASRLKLGAEINVLG